MTRGRLLKFAGNALFALLTAGIGIVILGLTVLPNVLRYQTYVVLSGSMEPTIHTGAVVVAEAVNPNSLKVGDVITFLRDGDQENVTHRIVSIKGSAQGRTFVTRGDANGTDDPGEIKFDHLAGKVTMSIPYLGYFFKFIGSPNMRILFIVVPGLLLLGSWLWDLWKPAKKPEDTVLPAAPQQSHSDASARVSSESLDMAPNAIPLRQ